jgi:hypothetical protein
MFQRTPIIVMHVCKYLLVCRLETKGVNLYTKKHLDTYVAMMGYNILYFRTEEIDTNIIETMNISTLSDPYYSSLVRMYLALKYTPSVLKYKMF